MRNSSWKHPFPTPIDKLFDKDKDGMLNIYESYLRDTFIDEMKRQEEKRKKRGYGGPYFPSANLNFNKTSTGKDSDELDSQASAGVQLFVIILVDVLLIGAFIFVFTTELPDLVMAIIMLGSVAFSLFLLREVGLYGSKKKKK